MNLIGLKPNSYPKYHHMRERHMEVFCHALYVFSACKQWMDGAMRAWTAFSGSRFIFLLKFGFPSNLCIYIYIYSFIFELHIIVLFNYNIILKLFTSICVVDVFIWKLCTESFCVILRYKILGFFMQICGYNIQFALNLFGFIMESPKPCFNIQKRSRHKIRRLRCWELL